MVRINMVTLVRGEVWWWMGTLGIGGGEWSNFQDVDQVFLLSRLVRC